VYDLAVDGCRIDGVGGRLFGRNADLATGMVSGRRFHV